MRTLTLREWIGHRSPFEHNGKKIYPCHHSISGDGGPEVRINKRTWNRALDFGARLRKQLKSEAD